jgi:uncharacterized membrane protein
MIYGFLIAELLWRLKIRNTSLQAKYNRALFWLLGMIGAISPDLDILSSIFANFAYYHYSWESVAFEIYHRVFSHGLVYLSVMIIIVVTIKMQIPKIHKEIQKELQFENMLGNMSKPKEKLPKILLLLWVLSFLLFNNLDYAWMNISLAIICIMMVIFAWSFLRIKLPYYSFVFFLAALSHPLCDFINCEWNPYGPWDMSVIWGLFLYCGPCGYCSEYGITIIASPIGQYWLFFSIFELIPLIIALIVFLTIVKKYQGYKQKLLHRKTNS